MLPQERYESIYSSEEAVSILNGSTEEATYSIPLDLHVWKRNPLFYALCLALVFSAFTLVIHVFWYFLFGILTAALAFILSALPAFYIFSRYKRRNRFTRIQLIKMGLTAVIIVGVCACGLYLEVRSVIVHFSATDPSWREFPTQCVLPSPTKPVYNCARVGNKIENPHMSTGSLVFPSYPTSLDAAKTVISDIFNQFTLDFSCSIITETTLTETEVFFHYRCLSPFFGYPDDLALKIFCDMDEYVVLWIHSQSRFGLWDHNNNDMRVRLFYNIIDTPIFSYNKTLNNGEKCKGKSLLIVN